MPRIDGSPSTLSDRKNYRAYVALSGLVAFFAILVVSIVLLWRYADEVDRIRNETSRAACEDLCGLHDGMAFWHCQRSGRLCTCRDGSQFWIP